MIALRAAVFTLALAAALGASAQTGRGDREALRRLQDERRLHEREREEYRAEARRTAAEIEQLRAELIALGRAQIAGERLAGDKRARLEALNEREAALAERLGRNRSALARLLGALQMHQRNPPPALFVSPRSAKEAARAAILVRAVTPEIERRGRVFAAEAEEIRKVRRAVVETSEDLFVSESEAAERRGRIETLILQKTALERRLNADADAADAAARRVAARASSLGDLVRGLSQQTLRGPLPAPALAPPMPARFLAPVEGELVRRFGEAGASKAGSQGVAWRTARNASVISPVRGRVEYVGPLKGYGVVLILRAGGAHHLVLAGMETAAPGVGREVEAGEPVGRMADRISPPPELYLEVREDGAPVNPARWLNGTPQRSAATRR